MLKASSSAPSLGLGPISDSDEDSSSPPSPPSPDIKAFHGETQAQPSDQAVQHSDQAVQHSDQAVQEATNTSQPTSTRRSTDSTFDSASAMPISASVASHRTRRPPLRANSTFVNRDGMGRPRANVKMVCHVECVNNAMQSYKLAQGLTV